MHTLCEQSDDERESYQKKVPGIGDVLVFCYVGDELPGAALSLVQEGNSYKLPRFQSKVRHPALNPVRA